MPIRLFDASGQVSTGRPLLGGAQAPQVPLGMDTGMGDLARGMGQLGAALAEIQQTREQARQADDFAMAKVGIEKGLLGLEEEFAQDAEPETVPQRFQERALKWRDDFVGGIGDDTVRQRIKPLVELGIAKQGIQVKAQAIKRETGKRTALLDNDTDFYMNKAIGQADDAGAMDVTREYALRLQGMAPFLGAEETQKRFQKFGEDVQFYRGREALRNAGGAPEVLGEILKRAPDLSPQRRDQLVEFSETERRAAVAARERADREAEKSVRESQDAYYLTALDRLESGQYTQQDWERDRVGRRLDNGQLATMRRSLGGGGGKDDAETIIRLEEMRARGEDVDGEVKAAMRSGRLSIATGKGYLAKDEESGPLGGTGYKEAKGFLGDVFFQSPMDKLDMGRQARKADAYRELRARTLGGESPDKVVADIRDREFSAMGVGRKAEDIQKDIEAAKAAAPVDPKTKQPNFALQAEKLSRLQAELDAAIRRTEMDEKLAKRKGGK